ncbi:hypothetical protein BH11PSE10_BH11PSE10_16480 [soil metagenome]
MRRFPFFLVLLCALSGCAGLVSPHQPLVVGVSQQPDVLASFGPPVRSWPNVDGGQTLEYSSQPFGQSCWMATLAADGRLLRLEDTLLPASRFSITPGMTPEQVSRRLGRERSRVFYRFSGEDVWDWNVAPDALGENLLRFNVHFKDGVVLRTSQSMVFPDRRFPFSD